MLPGDKAEALLLHGYTGSPYDLRPVGNVLSEHDVSVYVPLLKGHGTHARDLFDVTADQWFADARAIVTGFSPTKPFILGGLSMGALLAIVMACEVKKPSALLLFSPSLKLNFIADLTITSAMIGVLDKRVALKKLSGGSDVADPIAKAKTPAYRELPISGLVELEFVRQAALDAIAKIPCPIFLAFGKNDSAIDAHASHRLVMERAQQPIVSKFYERSKHLVTLDYDRERVACDVVRFLQDTCGIKL